MFDDPELEYWQRMESELRAREAWREVERQTGLYGEFKEAVDKEMIFVRLLLSKIHDQLTELKYNFDQMNERLKSFETRVDFINVLQPKSLEK